MLTVLLAPGSLNHTANNIKGFAIAIGIAIAVGFVWMWWVHRQRERNQELGSRAYAVWDGWLRLALAHPDLADPGRAGGAVDSVRYETFLATLLVTADQVLLFEDSARWRATIARHLEPHRARLASEEFKATTLKECSPALQRLIASIAGAR